ncbi:hypothetical protein AAHH80_34335, partial [Burkholderia pseudomallei]
RPGPILAAGLHAHVDQHDLQMAVVRRQAERGGPRGVDIRETDIVILRRAILIPHPRFRRSRTMIAAHPMSAARFGTRRVPPAHSES